MANLTNRYGSSLLALNTLRPPDRVRGETLVHLELKLPAAITAQVDLWEKGSRGPLDPREAASLLWTTPVARFLDGRVDAWRDVPGIDILLPGLEKLASTDQKTWPKDQAALQTLVAATAPNSPQWAAVSKNLTNAGAADFLNDLVLIFKYAAVNRERPVRTVAELYRLIRALMEKNKPPKTVKEVIAWLTSPLVIPRPLTTPSGAGGPRVPPPPPASPPAPPHPRFDLTSPRAASALDRLSAELSNLEASGRAAKLHSALRSSGVTDPVVLRRITREALEPTPGRGGDASPDTVREFTIGQPLRAASSEKPQIIRTQLYGSPVLIDVSEALKRTEMLRKEMAFRLVEVLPASLKAKVQQMGVALENLTIWPNLLTAAANTPSYLKPIGRSDLLLVRQTTTGYRRAEIAYIENILVGEKREREHTNRVLTRQEFFEQVERETEETRDLQVTDKAELSREVSKVVSEDLKVQGSVQVTSRGPTTVVASAGVSYDRSTGEAAKSSESYARETIERAVKRTMEKITRSTRSLFEQETTEVNRHGFERASNANDHVSGVYQYLERVSRAKMFWYGERELYDLLIPEPAALIWHLSVQRKELHIPIESPDAELFASLTVANIASKREDVIRAFRVTDMPPQADENLEASMSFSATGGGDSAKYANAKDVQIPEGYVVTGATFAASAEVEDEDDIPNGGVTVAGEVRLWEMSLSGNKGSQHIEFGFPYPLPGPTVSVAVNADNYTSFVGSVTLQLKLTDAARQAWALAAYGRVAERYEQLRREYAQAVIQASANQPTEAVSLPLGARSWLQQLVRFELQRAAIDIIRNKPVDFDAIKDYPFANADGSLGTHPSIDYAALHASEPEVRFLQQAFEWEHLSWVVYPYFWGRRSEWSRTVVISHPDPDFAAFLNAGAARVQVPVRPGFEDLVKHFMETGEVYEGQGLPKMGDPGYISFIDEQLTALGAPGEEVAWPPDNPREWDIVAPTSLLLVRSLTLSQLPTWDPKTGNET